MASLILVLVFTIVLPILPIFTDLQGEVMNFSSLNPELSSSDIEKLHLFECLDEADCKAGVLNREPSCVQRRRMTGLDSNSSDKYVIVNGEIGKDVELECHYCNEGGLPMSQMWYYYEKFIASKRFKVVPLHLAYPAESRKFVESEDHKLTIRNFTEADGALYFCQGAEDDSPKFVYLVDAVIDMGDLDPKRGNWSEYIQYHKETVEPLNKKLRDEYKKDLKRWFSTDSSIHNYNISHKWTDFGKCHSCGRDRGVRLRRGMCQLSIPTLEYDQTPLHRKRKGGLNFGYTFSCQSKMLQRFLSSSLRKKVNQILDFIEEMPCDEECMLGGLISGSSGSNFAGSIFETAQKTAGKEGGVELLNVLGTLGETLTLLCSDDLTADILWLKESTILIIPESTSKRSKSISFTRNKGGIHFPALNESDEGNYTCISNDLIKMVFRLKTQEPVTEIPIPERWIWIQLGIFSISCFLLWIFFVIIIGRVSWRIRNKYKPLTRQEEEFLNAKKKLMEGTQEPEEEEDEV